MTATYSAVPQVAIDGALDQSLRPHVAAVEVDERSGLPTAVTVTLRDADRDVIERAGIRIGATLEVSAGKVGEPAGVLLGSAEIVTVEVSYSDAASYVVVRGYDVSHRLHRGRRTRSYHDVTDGDVVRTVAEQAGLEVGTVDDPGVVHAHLAQLNLSDWDFLADRARACDRVLRVSEGRLDLVAREQAGAAPEPGDLTSTEARQLVLGRNLESLRARVSAAELPAEVEVRGWSPESKEPVLAAAAVAASGTEIGVSLASVLEGSSGSVLTSAERTLASQEEADELARALAEVTGSTFAAATGDCRGDPELRVGTPVSVGLAGSLVSGRWTVTAVRHAFDTEGYRTIVELGGTSALTELAVLGGARRGRDPAASVAGVVTGIVTDIQDDDDLARVRVSLPWLADDYVSDWARVVQPGAGPDRGAMLLPEVDDEVLVAFEHGDVRKPFVIGGLFNGRDRPPLESGAVDSSSGESTMRGLVSRLGHRIVLDDGTRRPGIVVSTGSGAVEIVLEDKTGDVKVTARGPVSVSGRSIELVGDAEVSIKAPNVSVEADGTLTLRGGVVRIN